MSEPWPTLTVGALRKMLAQVGPDQDERKVYVVTGGGLVDVVGVGWADVYDADADTRETALEVWWRGSGGERTHAVTNRPWPEVGQVWLAGPDVLGTVASLSDPTDPDARVDFTNGHSSYVSTLLDPRRFYRCLRPGEESPT